MTGNIENTQEIQNANFWELMANFCDVNVMKYYHETRKLDKFVYCKELKSGLWFEYADNNVLERRGDEPLYIKLQIKEDLEKEIKNELGKLQLTVENKSKCDLLKRNIKALSQSTFLTKAWKSYADIVGNYDLLEKLDSNANLIAFDNKLYDYSTKSFRNIEKSDLITFTAGYNLVEGRNKEAKAFINQVLTEIFPDEEMRNFWLLSIALSLVTNKMQKLFIWTGRGSNGKSLLSEFISYCFGNYYKTASKDFLTGDKNSNYDCDLSSAVGKRIIVCSEPEGKLKVSYVKNLTGEGTIQTRAIYGREFNLKMLLVPHMLTNDLPELTETGDAVRRRLEIIKFTVKFSDSPVGNEKKIDRGLKDKLLKFEVRNEFMLMLFDILRTSTHDDVNVKRPKASSEALNKYMADNDAIIPYISDYLQQTTNEKDRIGSSELFEHYIKNTPDGIPKFTTQKFAKSLESHGFEKKKSHGCIVWVGVKFKEPKQDEEEEEPEQKPEPEPIPEQKPEPKKKKMIKDKWFGMIEEDEVECPALEKRRERIKNFKTETLQIKGKALDHLAQAFGKPSKDPFAITFD